MAQTQLYGRKAQIILKEEASIDTYQVPAGDGTGGLLVEDGWTYAVESSNYVPKYAVPSFLNYDEVPGTASVTITFRLPIKGSGTAGTAPEFDSVLKACGWEVTNVGATSDTYAPISTFDGAGGNPGPSYSCTILVGGEAYPLKGGMGTFTISGTAGEPAFIECTMTGGYVAPLADALEAPVYDTTIPPAFMGASLAIGAATPTGVQSFTLDSGNEVVPMIDANDANGVTGARIVGRKITGSLTADTLAARDDFALWRAGTVAGTFTTGAIGGTAGNKWTLTVARVTRGPVGLDTSSGVMQHSIPFAASSQATDVEGTTDPATLAFT